MDNKWKTWCINLIIIIVGIILFFLLTNCQYSTEPFPQLYKVAGYITVVGNEPFASIALRTKENKILLLSCVPELEQELWKKQGSYCTVYYSRIFYMYSNEILVVEKVVYGERHRS